MSIAPSSDFPFISIIVPHYNQHAVLDECLASLKSQSLPRDRYEIIIVDNGSDGGIRDAIQKNPDVIFCFEENRGAANARNAGIDIAKGEIIAFTDADCVAEFDWLERGINGLRFADLSGGAINVSFQDDRAPTDIEIFEKIFAFRQQTYIKRKRFSVTANLFVWTRAAKAIGPFKNGVAEDLDWCRRAVSLGFRLAFNDTSIINHPARRDWSELTAKWRRLVDERWNGFRGIGPVRAFLWVGLAVATALSVAPHSLRVLFAEEKIGIGKKLSVVLVLARIRMWRAKQMLLLLA